MEALSVKGLCKEYPSFSLKDVSFSVEQGTIMGFIGRNGAGRPPRSNQYSIWCIQAAERYAFSAWNLKRTSWR